MIPVAPPRVEYRLTPLGASLEEPLASLCRWAERHLPQMLARERSQRRAAAERQARLAPGA